MHFLACIPKIILIRITLTSYLRIWAFFESSAGRAKAETRRTEKTITNFMMIDFFKNLKVGYLVWIVWYLTLHWLIKPKRTPFLYSTDVSSFCFLETALNLLRLIDNHLWKCQFCWLELNLQNHERRRRWYWT